MSKQPSVDDGSRPTGRPTIIGIYGLPGSGKTFLLNALRGSHSSDYIFIEGSDIIAQLTKGGLEAFENMDESSKHSMREEAIARIGADSLNAATPAIVTGHFMFHGDTDQSGSVRAWTKADSQWYTHIFYLKTPISTIFQRRRDDPTKVRPLLSENQLQQWQDEEDSQLRMICYDHGIIYHAVTDEMAPARVAALLQVLLRHRHGDDRRRAETMLDNFVGSGAKALVSALVLDADKTLSAADSGLLFWHRVQCDAGKSTAQHPLEIIFGPGYSRATFLQAALLYQEVVDQDMFTNICKHIAAQISLYPQVAALLLKVRSNDKVAAVVVTCGLQLVWEEVFKLHGMLDKVLVIGSGPLSNSLVITPPFKANLVNHLQQRHKLRVTAVGDSVLDLEMLAQADQAVIVVGNEKTRSRRMDKDLAEAIKGGLSASQAVLSPGSAPRLNTSILPLIDLNGSEFWNALFTSHSAVPLNVVHFTECRAFKILATAMRDAANSGPSLRSAHEQAGQHLALHSLPDLLGVEDYMIQHVQDRQVAGTRIAQQDRTLIVALMRGGEPIALGISEVLPGAPFLHARSPQDITYKHVDETSTIIIVDSVVNTGSTIEDFVQHLRKLGSFTVVVMAGVVQSEAVVKLQDLATLNHQQKLHLVALRFSDNKFTGRGATDTGNRLFQTKRLS